MKWWPRWVGDYAAKTRHLSLVEHGVFALLLDHYYTTEEPLPTNAEDLCRIVAARSEEEEAAVRKVADEFFPPNGDGSRHNERADEEVERAQRRRRRGRVAAEKRWGAPK